MKKTTKLITLMAALLLSILSLTACGGGSSALDLSEYLSITFQGTDGNGTAYLSFDAAQMELDYAGVKDGSPSQKDLEKMLSIAEFEYSISCDLDRSEGLSNGDKLTATITYNESLAKDAKMKIGTTTKSFTVEGLTEAIVIDPFAESDFGTDKTVQISFEYSAPFAELDIDNNADGDNPLSRVSYTADRYSDLDNGDVITITASLSDRDMREGYVLSSTETTITVEGLEYYANSAEDLTAAYLTAAADRAYQECLSNDFADIYDGEVNVTPWGVTFENIHVGDTALLLVNNDATRGYTYNALLVPVYETLSTEEWYNMDTMQNETKVWNDVINYYIFTEIIVKNDGSITNEDFVDYRGSYTDENVANQLFLNEYASGYSIIEVAMP